MIQIVKEPLDVHIQNPVGLPTPSPGHSHCLNRRLSRAVPIGILMEIRLCYEPDYFSLETGIFFRID
jgi:hypothetical protein